MFKNGVRQRPPSTRSANVDVPLVWFSLAVVALWRKGTSNLEPLTDWSESAVVPAV